MSDQTRGRRRLSGHGDDPCSSSEQGPRPKVFKASGSSTAITTVGSAPTASGRPSGSSTAITTVGSAPTGSGRPSRYDLRYEIINTRPSDVVTKQGTDGMQIRLQTNFFRLITTPKWRIYHYHVEFEPDIEMVRVRRGILSDHSNVLGSAFIFDGKQLFTTKKLEKDLTRLQGTSKTEINYTITIKYVGTISTAESRFLQVLNLILRRSMKGLKLELIGRNLFDPNAKIMLREHHMELWPGYETSIRQHERDILLCTEITHKVMRTETVYDILMRCINNPARLQEDFRTNVLGLVVLTDYNNRTYRINDVDFGQTPRSTFSCKGKDVSFVDYYLSKYNIRIRDQKQPLLISKNKDKAQNTQKDEMVILIPELCRVTGLTDNMRNDFGLMRAMSNHTRMNPQRRIERLHTFNRRLQNTPESVKVLTDWDMRLEEQLIKLNGRVISPQKIVFKANKVSAGNGADWTREFRAATMLTTPRNGLSRWAVIAPERNSRELRTLLESLMRVGRGMGFNISNPTELKIRDDRTGTYVRAMDDCARLDPMLVLCLVPNNNVERYSSIKKRGCIDKAIPTQVVTIRVANNRGLMSIATKIAIQINCKLGYTPWMIELPLSGLMTVGFDIAKCSRDRSKAYGGLVASMDLKENSTFFSTVAECSAYDVLANNLWLMLAKALRRYRYEHNKLPTRILFYRDGVSSGSLKQLVEYEVKDIAEKLKQEYQKAGENTQPMLAYIVVTKSSNTRFFTDSYQNPPAGTIVDDVVTQPERFDFYVVSQTVRQGTVSPTNYNVVYSTIGLSPDQIQKLTYKMCHLYYNWSGTTRVPAVCQYAKKLATLVATNLHAIPESALEKQLYYL
ncbi:protein piwi [Scaptodrosophila lebanonensis]|uniref:Protein piwi n=1 Tax=Drosophila lebanonensis TaxID=7225 RepID=A0A6J2U943_DROLE|nr:protein piwi [Scaptodrosophila lebanonensis]